MAVSRLFFAFSGPVPWAISTHLDKYLVERYFKRVRQDNMDEPHEGPEPSALKDDAGASAHTICRQSFRAF